jgi:hypothetical protein
VGHKLIHKGTYGEWEKDYANIADPMRGYHGIRKYEKLCEPYYFMVAVMLAASAGYGYHYG